MYPKKGWRRTQEFAGNWEVKCPKANILGSGLKKKKTYSVHLPGCPKQKQVPISLFQFPESSWITDWHPLSLAHRTMSTSINPSALVCFQGVRKEHKTVPVHTHWLSTSQPSWAGLRIGGSQDLCRDAGPRGSRNMLHGVSIHRAWCSVCTCVS